MFLVGFEAPPLVTSGLKLGHWGWVLLVACCVYTASFLLFSLLMVYRRNCQPLKFRTPCLLFATQLGALVSCSSQLLFLSTEAGSNTYLMDRETVCEVLAWSACVSYPLIVAPYFLRGYRLVRIFTFAGPSRESHRWKSLVITDGTLLTLLGGVLALAVALGALLHIKSFNLSWTDGACVNVRPVVAVMLLVVQTVALVMFFGRMRTVRDDFGTSREFVSVWVVWVALEIAQLGACLAYGDHQLWLWNPPVLQSEYVVVSSCLTVLLDCAVLGFSMVWPVVWTSAPHAYSPLWSSSDSLRSLDTLLKDIVCIQYFRSYLTVEATAEYILCWVEIELLRDLAPKAAKTKMMAGQIYEKYFKPSADMEVRVRLDIRDRLERSIFRAKEFDIRCFDEVQREVFDYMNGMFSKFLASESCRVCLQELETEELLKTALEESNMI